MAIDFKPTNTFGANKTERASTSEKAKTQYWLNIGYFAGEGEAQKFVALPMGIPLDTTDKLKVGGNNSEWAMFRAAQNNLLEQFVDIAAKLEPGDDYIINAEGNLAIQIRRIQDEQAAPPTDESNPYARPNLFALAAE